MFPWGIDWSKITAKFLREDLHRGKGTKMLNKKGHFMFRGILKVPPLLIDQGVTSNKMSIHMC